MKIKTGSVGLFLFVLLTIIILSPLAVIWSLNTLFHLGIVYSFETCLAVFTLGVLLSGKVSK